MQGDRRSGSWTHALEVCRLDTRLSRWTQDAQGTHTRCTAPTTGVLAARCSRTRSVCVVSRAVATSATSTPRGRGLCTLCPAHHVSHWRRIRANALPPSPPETRSSFGLATFRSPHPLRYPDMAHQSRQAKSRMPNSTGDNSYRGVALNRLAARDPWRQSTFACFFPAPLPRGISN